MRFPCEVGTQTARRSLRLAHAPVCASITARRSHVVHLVTEILRVFNDKLRPAAPALALS